jgi:hypothetical protein
MPTTISQKFNIVRYHHGIVVAILKMATSRNCSMSGINSGHHYLPTYQIVMISDNVDFLRYCGGHFENGEWPPQYRKKSTLYDIITI